jgi:hypothetical protein
MQLTGGTRLRALLISLYACAWLQAAPARADDEHAEQARQLFERGLQLSAQERWSEARELFQRSAELMPRANTYYNVAVSSLELGLGRATLLALAQFDALSADDTPEQHLKAAADLRARALAKVGTVTLSLAPERASVEVDGIRDIQATALGDGERLLWLDPGVHVVHVRAPDMRTQTLELGIAAGATVHHRIELAPETTPVAATAARPTPPVVLSLPAAQRAPRPRIAQPPDVEPAARDSGSLWSSPLTWVVLGAVVAAGATTAIVLTTRDEPRDMPYGGTTGVVF